MSHFDSVARSWDENPVNRERAEAVATSVEKLIPLDKKMIALEYGAGTGILGFLLHEKLAGITLMDSSREMINVMTEKIAKTGAGNLYPVLFDMEHHEYNGQKFDLIMNQMVLHHVIDIDSILRKFRECLNPGGYLAIADLYKEDGTFHSIGFTGHLGFEIDELTQKLKAAGFAGIHHEMCYRMKKKTENGVIKEFPLFMITASRAEQM